MKKRLLSMLLVVIMAFGLVACGSSEEAAEETTEATEETAEEVEIGTVVIGTDGAYPPFNYLNDDGELEGFEIAMLEEIGVRTGLDIKIEPMAWDGIFGQLDAGKIDTIVCCIFPSEERQEKYDFSTEYIYDENRIMVRKGDGAKYKTYEDLEGLKIGCTAGGNTYARLAELQEEVDFEIVGYDAERDVNDLMLERLDAVYKSPISVFVQAEQLGFEVEVAECPTLESASCAFPFVRDNARAAAIDEAFSAAIKEMIEDGTMKALSEEWLGMDVTCYEPLFDF